MHGNLMPFVDDYYLVGGFKHFLLFSIYGMCVILGYLVGGLEHEFYFSITYGMSSFPLTNIFQDSKNHQPDILCIHW